MCLLSFPTTVHAQCPDAANDMCTIYELGTQDTRGCSLNDGCYSGSHQAYILERFYDVKQVSAVLSSNGIAEKLVLKFDGWGPQAGNTQTINIGPDAALNINRTPNFGPVTLDSQLKQFNFWWDKNCVASSGLNDNLEGIYWTTFLDTIVEFKDFNNVELQTEVILTKPLIGFKSEYNKSTQSSYYGIKQLIPIYDDAPFPQRCSHARYRPEPSSYSISIDAELGVEATHSFNLAYYAFSPTETECTKTASINTECTSLVSITQNDPAYSLSVTYTDTSLIGTTSTCTLSMIPGYDFGGLLTLPGFTVQVQHVCTLTQITCVNVIADTTYILGTGAVTSSQFNFGQVSACNYLLTYTMEVYTVSGATETLYTPSPGEITLDQTSRVITYGSNLAIGSYKVKVVASHASYPGVSNSFEYFLTVEDPCKDAVISLDPVENIIANVGQGPYLRTLVSQHNLGPASACSNPIYTITPTVSPDLTWVDSSNFSFQIADMVEFASFGSSAVSMSVQVTYGTKTQTFTDHFTIQAICQIIQITHTPVNPILNTEYIMGSGLDTSNVFSFDQTPACGYTLSYDLEVYDTEPEPDLLISPNPTWISLNPTDRTISYTANSETDLGIYDVRVTASHPDSPNIEDTFFYRLDVVHRCSKATITLDDLDQALYPGNVVLVKVQQGKKQIQLVAHNDLVGCGSPVYTVTTAANPGPALIKLSGSEDTYEVEIADMAQFGLEKWSNTPTKQMTVEVQYDYKTETFPLHFDIKGVCEVQTLEWITENPLSFTHIILMPPNFLSIDFSVKQDPQCDNPTAFTLSDVNAWISVSSNTVEINPTLLSQENFYGRVDPGQEFTATQTVDGVSLSHTFVAILKDPCYEVTVKPPVIVSLDLALQSSSLDLNAIDVPFEPFTHELMSIPIDCQAFQHELIMDSPPTADFPSNLDWVVFDPLGTISFNMSAMDAKRDIGQKFEFTLRAYLQQYTDREASVSFSISLYSFMCKENAEEIQYQISQERVSFEMDPEVTPFGSGLQKVQVVEVQEYLNGQVGDMLSKMTNIPKFLSFNDQGYFQVYSNDNSLTGAYQINFETSYPDISHSISCKQDLVIEEKPFVFNSTKQNGFSMGELPPPEVIYCVDKNWVYKLPEVKPTQGSSQTKYIVQVRAATLTDLVVHDPFYNELRINQKKILPKDEGFHSIFIDLYDQLSAKTFKVLNVTISCPIPENTRFVRNQAFPLIPKISRISQDGLVTVIFNTTMMYIPADKPQLQGSFPQAGLSDRKLAQEQDINLYKNPSFDSQLLVRSQVEKSYRNYTQVHNSSVMIEEKPYPGLEVFIQAGPYQTPSYLDFSWEIVDYRSNGFDMQLNFYNLQQVSSSGQEDILYLKFNSQEVFKDGKNNYIIPQYETSYKLPRMIEKEELQILTQTAEAVTTTLTIALVQNVIINFFLQGALNQLMQYINVLQIIAHLALAEIVVPAVTQLFYAYLFKITTFEVINLEEDIDNFFELEPTEPFSLNFAMISYGSNYFLTNLSSSILLIPVLPILIFLVWALQYVCSCWPRGQRIAQQQYRLFFWKRILRITEELYLIITITSLLNLKQGLDNVVDKNISFYASIGAIAVVLGYPISIMFLYCRDSQKLAEEFYKERFGELYENYLDFEKGGRFVFVHILLSIFRRLALAIIMVYMNSQPFLQILSCLVLSQLILMFTGLFKPFEGRRNNIVEISSEVLVILTIYFLIFFEVFSAFPEFTYKLGYGLNVMTVAYIVLIVISMFRETIRTVYISVRRYLHQKRLRNILQFRFQQRINRASFATAMQLKLQANQFSDEQEGGPELHFKPQNELLLISQPNDNFVELRLKNIENSNLDQSNNVLLEAKHKQEKPKKTLSSEIGKSVEDNQTVKPSLKRGKLLKSIEIDKLLEIDEEQELYKSLDLSQVHPSMHGLAKKIHLQKKTTLEHNARVANMINNSQNMLQQLEQRTLTKVNELDQAQARANLEYCKQPEAQSSLIQTQNPNNLQVLANLNKNQFDSDPINGKDLAQTSSENTQVEQGISQEGAKILTPYQKAMKAALASRTINTQNTNFSTIHGRTRDTGRLMPQAIAMTQLAIQSSKYSSSLLNQQDTTPIKTKKLSDLEEQIQRNREMLKVYRDDNLYSKYREEKLKQEQEQKAQIEKERRLRAKQREREFEKKHGYLPQKPDILKSPKHQMNSTQYLEFKKKFTEIKNSLREGHQVAEKKVSLEEFAEKIQQFEQSSKKALENTEMFIKEIKDGKYGVKKKQNQMEEAQNYQNFARQHRNR